MGSPSLEGFKSWGMWHLGTVVALAGLGEQNWMGLGETPDLNNSCRKPGLCQGGRTRLVGPGSARLAGPGRAKQNQADPGRARLPPSRLLVGNALSPFSAGIAGAGCWDLCQGQGDGGGWMEQPLSPAQLSPALLLQVMGRCSRCLSSWEIPPPGISGFCWGWSIPAG